MGSWLGTCILSNLPLLEGEPARGFLIRPTGKQLTGVASCYYNEYATLSTPPVLGQYADYGRLGGIKPTPITRYLTTQLQEPSLESAFRAAERGENGYGLVLMHEEVWQAMRAEAIKIKDWDGHTPHDQAKLVIGQNNRIRKAQALHDTMGKKLKQRAITLKEAKALVKLSSRLTEMMLKPLQVWPANNNPDASLLFPGLALGKETAPFLEAHVDVMVLSTILSSCRISLLPQSGAGCQNLGTVLQRARFKAALDVAKGYPKD